MIFKFLKSIFPKCTFWGSNWVGGDWYGIFWIREKPALRTGLIRDKLVTIILTRPAKWVDQDELKVKVQLYLFGMAFWERQFISEHIKKPCNISVTIFFQYELKGFWFIFFHVSFNSSSSSSSSSSHLSIFFLLEGLFVFAAFFYLDFSTSYSWKVTVKKVTTS